MNDEQSDLINKDQEPIQEQESKQEGEQEQSEASQQSTPPANSLINDTQPRFTEFDLPPSLLKAFDELGFEFCTPIQALSLKVTMDGHDVTGRAQTGTGKTAAFLTTIINDQIKNPINEDRFVAEPRALIIAPTRELVMQIAKDALSLTKFTDLHVQTLVGGIDYQKQQDQLEQKIVDIVVATPGRLIDFVGSRKIDLSYVETLVIDEADRMLDMGFIPQVRQIISACPKKEFRQTMLYSATFTEDIMELADRWALDPVRIEVASEQMTTENVDQKVYLVTTEEKYKLLYNLILKDGSERVIVFTNRRDQARRLADSLHRNGIEAGLLTGEIAQQKRVRTLEDFRTATIQVLVATDVAGRGLHIEDISHVVNFTLPLEAEDYVHRIGRTGRAGAEGTSVSFACEDDSFLLPDIEEKIGKKLDCEHPDESLLSDPPAFSRPSKFKADKPNDKRKGKHHKRR
ncbi:MAG: ATP-dependent RNA helicase RhlB [Gammaproteobacteria bacterium]|nr:ATP-dependent RNA helicase RhlB [Gammaproteobacteria bacterium]